MKRMNKLLCLALAVVMVLGLLTTGCAKTTSDTVHHKIGVALYTDSGKSVIPSRLTWRASARLWTASSSTPP